MYGRGGKVSHNGGGLEEGQIGEYILQTKEKGAHDLLCCLYKPIESSVIRGVTIPVPESKDGCGEVHLLQLLEKVWVALRPLIQGKGVGQLVRNHY